MDNKQFPWQRDIDGPPWWLAVGSVVGAVLFLYALAQLL